MRIATSWLVYRLTGYVSRFAPVRTLLLLLALVSLMGMPYTVLMPAMAREALGGGPDALGFLMTASGAGALAGALYLASRKSVVGLGRVIVMATVLFGIGLAAFGLSRNLLLSIAIMPVVGAGFMMAMAATNTILLGGVAYMGAAAWFSRRLPAIRKLVRPIYIERGIIVLPPAEGAA